MSGTIIPQLEGYSFQPASKDFTNLEQNIIQDFEGVLDLLWTNDDILEIHKMRIYPNPSNYGRFTMAFPRRAILIKEIKVFSLSRLVYSVKVNKYESSYTLTHNLSSGAYFISVVTDLGTFNNKIIVN
ncbi:T9SS type A sorting domain-containing protein [Tamlana sp. 2_MG-2023]|uniref:T9SS type A sorting domain-containing protein n=1 Tax=unclassified Tamlana TaxID=2614803 RepID=UPI0026E28683|nr:MULTISPECIES: T9SS type A sorting domain-containing protein [unclassified Tamlana]MDO6759160.1 T9SS type A sorting domain-containing protein [Tamlana sp. 2_MG-2023]MDO6790701.1 T9SS type A sorting domain-containing protein [Tamlana sp. 1_MG-2023]